MITNEKTLSVSETARLCDVSRGTINYWIKAKKLHAKRSGRNYSIPVNELLLFLKSSKKEIPHELKNTYFQRPLFRSFLPCWEYWHGKDHGPGCKDCVVYINKLETCFTAKESSRFQCDSTCAECQYYLEVYLPKIQFVNQFNLPAVIYKDLYVWAGNNQFSELFEVQKSDLPGMGIEQLIHPDSLSKVISIIKHRALGDQDVPKTYSIYLNNRKHGKLKVTIAVYSLKEPLDTYLVFVEANKG